MLAVRSFYMLYKQGTSHHKSCLYIFTITFLCETAQDFSSLKRLLLYDPVKKTDLNSVVFCSMGVYEEKKETCGTICLKYLLFTFNFLFWVSFLSGRAEPARRT